MSRIGKKPIEIPSGVTVTLDPTTITVKGPKGTLKRPIPPYVSIHVANNAVNVEIAGEGRRLNRFQGLARALLANMISGVSQGVTKQMSLVGVGYRVALDGRKLVFSLGFSSPIPFPLPPGIEAEVGDKGLSFTVRGFDHELIGQTCATIRSFRPPEPYKGKGVRYLSEVVRQKAGKAGAK